MATMIFASRLAHVENIPQQDSAERALNKLACTFIAQFKALKWYRTGGQRLSTVEHVIANQGGQAMVGQVAAGGRGGAPRCSANGAYRHREFTVEANEARV